MAGKKRKRFTKRKTKRIIYKIKRTKNFLNKIGSGEIIIIIILNEKIFFKTNGKRKKNNKNNK